MQLDEVRVLDLSRLLPGPYATQLLADAGADVIKVEDTKVGDYARETPPLTDDGVGVVFDALNRGKRSVSIDLHSDDGRDVFFRLVEEADVVFEQFRPGVVQDLGVDYESVREHNPNIVYCSLTGYGQEGPYSGRVGHDLNYVGTAGVLEMTRRDREEAPRIPGIPIADMSGGLCAAFSIVGALLSRELGGTNGEYLDISMTDVVLSFSHAIGAPTLSGQDAEPGNTRLTGQYPCYDVYRTADDRYVTLAALEPKFWETFCTEIDRPDLVEKHMARSKDVREDVRRELADVFVGRTREEWTTALADKETMVAPVYTIDEAFDQPHIESRMLRNDGDGPPRIDTPLKGSDKRSKSSSPPPEHGEHTDAVLREAGVEQSKLQLLRERDVIR